jgi:perosamine synthetase
VTRIPVAAPVLTGNEAKYVQECLESTWISSAGRFIGEFESGFAAFTGTRHAVATNNGTTALHLALVALGIGPGDEVIVPTLTYVASANAVRYVGATVVLADADPRTLNLCPEDVLAKITPRTKAVIPVHLYGHPCDMDPIVDACRARGIAVLEDAAESHGARYKGRPTGSLGDLATFSFFGNNIITTGEGGMVVTDDDALERVLRLHRGQGMDPDHRYWFPVVGFNYRMTNIQAAIGVAQLERVDELLEVRQQVARWYTTHLAGSEDLVVQPVQEEWAHHAFWIYNVLLTAQGEKTRDAVMRALDADGIETRPVFYPMHVMPVYTEDSSRFPVATDLAARGINLPTHGLLTEEDVARVCERLLHHARELS